MSDYPIVESIPAWVTPLFASQLSAHDALKADVLALIYQQRDDATDAIASRVGLSAKQGLSESTLDFLDTDAPCITDLNETLRELVLMAATEANYNNWPEDAQVAVDITESWFHVTTDGGYHDVHSHPNCSWCGIYFLEPGESSLDGLNGVNRFYDPRINAEHYLDAGSQYLNTEGVWDFEPIAGQVIIFPSYLKHSALVYLWAARPCRNRL